MQTTILSSQGKPFEVVQGANIYWLTPEALQPVVAAYRAGLVQGGDMSLWRQHLPLVLGCLRPDYLQDINSLDRSKMPKHRDLLTGRLPTDALWQAGATVTQRQYQDLLLRTFQQVSPRAASADALYVKAIAEICGHCVSESAQFIQRVFGCKPAPTITAQIGEVRKNKGRHITKAGDISDVGQNHRDGRHLSLPDGTVRDAPDHDLYFVMRTRYPTVFYPNADTEGAPDDARAAVADRYLTGARSFQPQPGEIVLYCGGSNGTVHRAYQPTLRESRVLPGTQTPSSLFVRTIFSGTRLVPSYG